MSWITVVLLYPSDILILSELVFFKTFLKIENQWNFWQYESRKVRMELYLNKEFSGLALLTYKRDNTVDNNLRNMMYC